MNLGGGELICKVQKNICFNSTRQWWFGSVIPSHIDQESLYMISSHIHPSSPSKKNKKQTNQQGTMIIIFVSLWNNSYTFSSHISTHTRVRAQTKTTYKSRLICRLWWSWWLPIIKCDVVDQGLDLMIGCNVHWTRCVRLTTTLAEEYGCDCWQKPNHLDRSVCWRWLSIIVRLMMMIRFYSR